MSLVLGLFVVFSLAGNILQNPPQLSAEKLIPNFSKINPVAGLKRLFSAPTVVEFVKNVINISGIGAILVAVILPDLDSLEPLIGLVEIGRASCWEPV